MSENQNKLELLTVECGGGRCPTLYKDSEGRIFVQGNKVDARTREQLNVDSNEEIVEITKELVDFLKQS